MKEQQYLRVLTYLPQDLQMLQKPGRLNYTSKHSLWGRFPSSLLGELMGSQISEIP